MSEDKRIGYAGDAGFTWLSPAANPLGVLAPSRVAKALKTGFWEFESPYQVRGLVLVEGDTVNLLAVLSDDPGQGHFALFMDKVEGQFKEIVFWSMMSADLDRILSRRGYVARIIPDKFGEMQRCMILERWKRHEQDAAVPAGDGDRSEGTLAPGGGQAVDVG
jgi:hypothetical protein